MSAEPLLTYDVASPFALPPYGSREADRLYRQVIAVFRDSAARASPPRRDEPTEPPPPPLPPPEPRKPIRPATSRTGPFVVRPLSKRGAVSRTGRASFADSRRDAFAFAIEAARKGRAVAVLGRGYAETVLATFALADSGAVRLVRADGAVAFVAASADAVLAAASLAFDGTTFQRG